MKQASTIFLQFVIVLIGVGALGSLLWEPWIEGRNAHATFFQIYFNDPFLAWAYMISIAFFVALYQAFTLLGRVRRNELFSQRSVAAMRRIKHCALIIIGGFILPAEAYLFFTHPGDDIAGGVFMGMLVGFFCVVVAAVADVGEGILKSGVNAK